MTQINTTQLLVSPLHLCGYLPDRASRLTYLSVSDTQNFNQQHYTTFSHLGFRRSGDVIYRPLCRHCQQCISARVLVDEFHWSRRYRKVLNRNQDISISVITTSQITDEHYALYERYICQRHADGDMYPPSKHTFERFLVDSPVNTCFVEVRALPSPAVQTYTKQHSPSRKPTKSHKPAQGRLLAVAVTDYLDDGLSSVYSFFEPSIDFQRRSLGVLCILLQIQIAKLLGKPYVYLGYWVPEATKMAYKTQYLPLELNFEFGWVKYDTVPTFDDVKILLATKPLSFMP